MGESMGGTSLFRQEFNIDPILGILTKSLRRGQQNHFVEPSKTQLFRTQGATPLTEFGITYFQIEK